MRGLEQIPWFYDGLCAVLERTGLAESRRWLASGAVAVAERVRIGQTLQFQIRDAEASRQDLREMLDVLAERLHGRRPAFGCYFDCAGRGRGLYGVPDHDVSLIRERLGEFPLVGFFRNGEFAPIGRRNFFHNYTGALVIFPEA